MQDKDIHLVDSTVSVQPPSPSREEVELYIENVAPNIGVPVQIALNQCQAESSFDQRARSSCGAIGLFQLMPETAKGLGVDPMDWKANVNGGLKYMRMLKRQFGEWDRALAAYNWGPGHISKLVQEHPEDWKDHLPLETANYLKKILV